MSMWEFEALAEMTVAMVDASDLSPRKKRTAFANAYALVEVFDVSFVHFRSAKALIDSSFLHRIEMTQHPDYADHKAYFDEIIAGGESEWINIPQPTPDDFSPAGGIYIPDPHADYLEPGLWFDSTMPLWSRAVDAGLLTGLATEPVEIWSTNERIARFIDLAAQQGAPQHGLLKMLHGALAYLLLYEGEVPEVDDATLAPARDNPAIKAALAETHEDWIDERFDARTMLEHAQADQRPFLEWWCAPYQA